MLFIFINISVVTTTAADIPPTAGTPVPSTATYVARPLPPGMLNKSATILCTGSLYSL